MPTTDLIQAAVLSYMKSKTSITSLLDSSDGIKESQWQGDTFTYPAVRLSTSVYPSIDGCSPDKANIGIETYSEEKSSLQAQQISAAIQTVFHKVPFTSNGLRFSSVVVRSVEESNKDIYAWKSRVNLEVLVI